MLLSHVLGASIVEGLVTALVGVAYLQKNHPEYLTSLRNIVAGGDVPEGQVTRRPTWTITGATIIGGAVLLVLGLITGGGDPGKLFGADWSSVSWGDVAVMLLIVGIMAAALVPLAWFILPARMKK